MEDRAKWERTERALWAAFMNPERRTITLHGLSRKDPQWAKLRAKLEEQREREFAQQWHAYRDWLAH